MNAILKINTNDIIFNICEYKKKLKRGQKFCAVVKANAYGLGDVEICKRIKDYVDYFAVATYREFLRLRKVATRPIILLDPIYENITKLAKQDCEFCVSNVFQFDTILSVAARNKNVLYKIHLKINTGMNRFGFSSKDELFKILNKIKKAQNIFIFGLFSHFYLGNDENIAKFQVIKFNEFKYFLSQKMNLKDIIFHIANTSGFDFGLEFDMVRIGLGLFLNNNKQCFSLVSKIVEIQNIKLGETVGYGLGFFADKNMHVGVVSIGYADGVMRCLAGKGFVLINSKRCKVLAVCMDSIIVDMTDVKARLLDEVVLIGKSGDEQIFICEMASWCGTIEYEIMTRISNRVKRVYVGGEIDANHNGEIPSKETSGG